MFSSNQLLDISGDLNESKLKSVLDFVVSVYGGEPNAYQITDDKRFVLGYIYKDTEGWEKFQFDYDNVILSRIIYNHLNEGEIEYGDWDGGYHKGFRVKAVEESMAGERKGIKIRFMALLKFLFTLHFTQNKK